MEIKDYLHYIEADPEICHGKPVFKGTRVMVWQVLELLGAGYKTPQILDLYDSLPTNAIDSALGFAVDRAREVSYIPIPTNL